MSDLNTKQNHIKQIDRRKFCKQALKQALFIAGLARFAPVEIKNAFASENEIEGTLHKQARYVMGTILDIRVFDQDKEKTNKFFNEAFELADKLDHLLSNHKNTSEISKLNLGEKIRISKHTKEVLEYGRQFQNQTENKFNISVMPLIKLWKEASSKGVFPSDIEIAKAKELSTTNTIDNQGEDYYLSDKKASIATGGIGKGYAVEKIKNLLNKYSINSALINFGHSTIYAHGSPKGQDHWKVALQFPNQSAKGILSLKDQAASASSAFGESFQISEKKLGHIINPLTGIPVKQKRLVAVTSKSSLIAEVASSEAVLSKKANFKEKDFGMYYQDTEETKILGKFDFQKA